MTGDEIRALINKNNEQIEELMRPNQFILNTLVRDLLIKNKELQEQCPHTFNEKGYCIFCDALKE